MENEKLFCACNIPKLLENQINQTKASITEGMTKENLEGFDYAVETMLSLLKQTIHAAEMDNEIFVHSDKIADNHELEEFDLEDLLELLIET